MAHDTPSHETHLEEGLLPVVADEKRTLLTADTPSPPGSGYPQEKPQRASPVAMLRRFFIFALCFLVSFSLASVLSPHVRCARHQDHGDVQAALPAGHADVSELREPVDGPEPDLLHRLLHAYFPKSFQDGVYPSDRDALSAVKAEDAGLASELAHLAKRQDGNDTEPTPSSVPNDPTDTTPEPTPTLSSPSQPPSPPPPPPTTTAPTEPPPPPPPPSTTAPPPPPPSPSSPSPPPPPPPPPPSSESETEPTTEPPPPPPPSSEPSESPTTSAAEPSDPASSTSSEEETTTTSARRTTSRPTTSTSFQSSSEVVTTRTSTEADGDVVIVTETSYVGVDPTPLTTGASGEDPDLQNAAPRTGVAGVIAAGLAAMAAAMLL